MTKQNDRMEAKGDSIGLARKVRGVRAAALAASVALVSMGSVAGAQTSTWQTATSVQAAWSASENWDTVPTVGSTSVVNFYTAPGTPLANSVAVGTTNDLTGLSINQLNIFASGPSAAGAGSSLRLTGNTIAFSGANAQLNVNAAYGNGGSGGLTVNINAPLRLDADTTITYSNGGAFINLNGGFSGSGNLTFVGNLNNRTFQPTVPSPTNAQFTGNVTISKGILSLVQQNNVFGANASGNQVITIAAGASAQANNWNGAAAYPQSFAISGTGTGTGALVLTGLNFGDGSIRGIQVDADATVNIGRNAGSAAAMRSINMARGLSGSGTLTKIGNGQLNLNGTGAFSGSLFTGNLVVNEGIVQGTNQHNLLGINASGTQTVTIASNAQVRFEQNSGAYTYPQDFIINGTGTGTTTGALISGALVFNNQRFGNSNIRGLTVATDASIAVNLNTAIAAASQSLQLNGPLAGAGNLTKLGNGGMIFTQSSAYTGNILVSGGQIRSAGQRNNVWGSNASGTQTITVNSGTQALLDQANGAFSQPQTFVLNGTGTGTVTGALAVIGLNFGNPILGGLQLASDSTVSVALDVTAGTNAFAANIATAISGTGVLTKIGNGGLALLGGTSTYAANVNVNGGYLALGGVVEALGPNTGGTQAVNVAANARAVLSGVGSAPQIFNLNGAGTSGATGALAKTGAGTYSVGSVNYQTPTTVNVASGSGELLVVGTVGGTGSLTKVGSGTLTYAGSTTNSAAITVSEGTLAVGNGGTTGELGSGAVSLGATGRLLVNRSDSVTVPNTITTAGGTFAVRGGGTTTLTGSLSGFAGNVEVSTADTRLIVNTPLRPVTGSLVVTGPGASFHLAVPVGTSGYTTAASVASINVGTGSRASVAPTVRTADNASVVETSALELNGNTGWLDLGNNDLVLRGAGAAGVTSLRASVKAWVDGGNGTGLGSSVAASAVASFTTLAVFGNSAQDGSAYFASYDGLTLTAADAIVKYTYVGDTNLDGTLDGRDMVNLLEGLSAGLTGWENGDVNYDGVVDSIDYGAFSAAYAYVTTPSNNAPSYGGGQGVGGSSGAIPEPAGMGLLAGVVAPMLTRRRRSAR